MSSTKPPDFGVSRIKLGSFTSGVGVVGGTLRWQSPERIAKGISTRSSDVYSFGMTAFELISLEVPFGYTDDSDIKRLVVGQYFSRNVLGRVLRSFVIPDIDGGLSLDFVSIPSH